MVRKIRKLAEQEGFVGAALMTGILPAIYIIGWPYALFHGDARWVGLAFWITLLVLAAIVTVVATGWTEDVWAERNWTRRGEGETSSVDTEDDKRVFKGKVRDGLNDRSCLGYFKRNLVKEDDVANALVDGDAFLQARETDSYESFALARENLENITGKSTVLYYDAFNLRAATAFASIFVLAILLLVEISRSGLAASGMACTSLITIGVSSCLFSSAQHNPEHRLHKLAFSVLAMCIALCVIILPFIFLNIRWNSFITISLIWLLVVVLGYIIPIDSTIPRCLCLIGVGVEQGHLLFLRDEVRQLQTEWLDNCAGIIKEQANLTINTILGKDKDRLLVEHDSEGLRRLQDPSYTVSTRSERRIASVLVQMDGASIALAGPRGAGKSTLLKKFSGPLRYDINDPGISLYLTAPAEYIPRDFIATLFQRLCEEYLRYEECALPRPIYKEHSKLSSGHELAGLIRFLWLVSRTFIFIGAIAWVMRTLISTHYHDMYETTLTAFSHWYNQTYHFISKDMYRKIRPYWAWIRIFTLIVSVLCLLGMSGRWKGYIKPRREPALAKSAREHLRRLQIEKTIIWGKGASIGMPATPGGSLSLNRGGTASYVPWTLPELVEHMRRFMRDISQQFGNSSHALIIAIDEIDRIGSLEHAEKFVGEIKAIFGVEKCFFLVAVAEDVGSIFAQRATTGRSILENAFDDILLVEPLDLLETRDLLLKRVPGFTDSFVYLVQALSGGIPRELIRITRRLVDVNQEASTATRHAKLQDLTFCLVKEQILEAIRAMRNQMARLMLHSNWTIFFQRVHSANIGLRHASPFSVHESHRYIKELADLTVPDAPEGVRTKRELVIRDEDEAERIVRGFTAFSYFGLTVIEAFSDRYFDLETVQLATISGSEGSYEQLAVARAELTVSPENSRAMLRRFRDSLSARSTDTVS